MSATISAERAAATRSGRSYFGLIVAGIVVVGTFLIINSSFSGGVLDYSSLATLNADWESALGREIQVSGDVVPGSVRGDADQLDVTFDIADGTGGTLTIHYARLLPDPFAEGRQVIVTGVLASERLLEGSNLTVKCPSRYQDGATGEREAAEHYQNQKHPKQVPSQ